MRVLDVPKLFLYSCKDNNMFVIVFNHATAYFTQGEYISKFVFVFVLAQASEKWLKIVHNNKYNSATSS